MKVLIPSPLQSYTGGARAEAAGETLGALLHDLEAKFPGIRFRMVDEQDRIRRHIRIFINGRQTFDLNHALNATDDIAIVQALSGG